MGVRSDLVPGPSRQNINQTALTLRRKSRLSFWVWIAVLISDTGVQSHQIRASTPTR